MKRTVLMTGAAGRIGTALVEHLETSKGDQYDLVLGDLEASGRRTIELDVRDFASCRDACEGVDTVVHLAGLASPDSPFEALLPINIGGTYNVLQAAVEAGVRRVVFASSAQVVEGYPVDVQVRADMPVRPKNLYGVSKACGEALAAYFADQAGLEAVAVRIGAFEYPSEWLRLGARDLSAWASPRDLCELLARCIEADLGRERFVIAHGISNNRFKRLDLAETRTRLGYTPEEDAFEVWGVGLGDASEPVT